MALHFIGLIRKRIDPFVGARGVLNTMRIELLADHPDWISSIAKWHWNEWGHHDEDGSLEKWTEGLAGRTHRDRIPITFVAVEGDRPVGSATLVEHDMDTHKDLSPWLAGVFVLPQFRARGIASKLVHAAMAGARNLGVETLYLYSRSAVGLYEKLGW